MLRRLFLAGTVAGGASLLMGHSPYRKWAQYRARHTVIATDGSDAEAPALGEQLAARLVVQRPELNATATRAQSSAAVLSLLRSRQLDVALLRGEDAYQGLHGAGPYTALVTPLCALAGIAPEYLYVLTSAQSTIRTTAELKGRRVGVADAGGRVVIKVRRLVAASGVDPDADVRWSALRAADAVAALDRGEVDAWCLESPASRASAYAMPQPGGGHRLRAVGQGDAVRALIDRHGPVYFAAHPADGAGAGLATDGPVLGEVRLFVCRDDYPAERARTLAVALEGWEGLAPPKTPLPIPLHPAVATLKQG
jgi:TRAP transporter TAXI family solute receptor